MLLIQHGDDYQKVYITQLLKVLSKTLGPTRGEAPRDQRDCTLSSIMICTELYGDILENK